MQDDKDLELHEGDEDLENEPEEEQDPGEDLEPEENQDPGDEPEGCEEECEEECEPEGAAAGKNGKGKGNGKGKKGEEKPGAKPATPAPATSAKQSTLPTSGFTYPFLIRYGGEFLDLEGFKQGQTYTTEQIRQILIQNGFIEFKEMNIALYPTEDKTVLAVTIKGSQKGGRHGC